MEITIYGEKATTRQNKENGRGDALLITNQKCAPMSATLEFPILAIDMLPPYFPRNWTKFDSIIR